MYILVFHKEHKNADNMELNESFSSDQSHFNKYDDDFTGPLESPSIQIHPAVGSRISTAVLTSLSDAGAKKVASESMAATNVWA